MEVISTLERLDEKLHEIGVAAAVSDDAVRSVFATFRMDIAVDPKGMVWLLEVNPKPSREVFRKIGESSTYQKAVTRSLEYAIWKMKQNQKKTEEIKIE